MQLDPAYFFSAPELTWKIALKQTKLKLDLVTGTDMLLIIEKSIRDGICHAIQA